MQQPNLFDAIAERNAAMNSVEGNTDSNWLRAAETAVNWLAKSRLNGFTTDDVWQRLDDMGMTGQVHDNRALGPVMLRQARAGVIVSTGHYAPSHRRHCAPIKVWRGV
jgi:NAD(P)-dependent dehydrogenase (short-subunit alcohol dehydrogenase family)